MRWSGAAAGLCREWRSGRKAVFSRIREQGEAAAVSRSAALAPARWVRVWHIRWLASPVCLPD